MRKKIVAGNWKMNKTIDDATQLVEELIREIGDQNAVDVFALTTSSVPVNSRSKSSAKRLMLFSRSVTAIAIWSSAVIT